jgi:uncharacterized protein YciI
MSDTPQWIYVLRLTRPEMGPAPSEREMEIVGRHFAYLKDAHERDETVLLGRCEDFAFGIVIFEAPDEHAAREFMLNDPAVAEGVMTAELHPYRVALMRGERID